MQSYLPNDLISLLKLTRAFKKTEVQRVKIEENVEPGDGVTYWGDTGRCRVVGLCSWEMFNLRNARPYPSPILQADKGGVCQNSKAPRSLGLCQSSMVEAAGIE